MGCCSGSRSVQVRPLGPPKSESRAPESSPKNLGSQAYRASPLDDQDLGEAADAPRPRALPIVWTLSDQLPRALKSQITDGTIYVEKVLGTGISGTVYLWSDLASSRFYAVKVMPQTKFGTQKQYGYYEYEATRDIDHPLIVKGYGGYKTKKKLVIVTHGVPSIEKSHYGSVTTKDSVLVMDYVPGEELFDIMQGSLSYEDIQSVAAQVLLALEYMHKQGYMYRDLKPENILFYRDAQGRPRIKIIDLGFTRKLIADSLDDRKLVRSDSLVGTSDIAHMGMLETLFQPAVACGYGAEVDFWAYGILLYKLFTRGDSPFSDRIEDFDSLTPFNQLQAMYHEIRRDPHIHFPSDVSIPEVAKDLIRKLLCNGRGRIISWDEVRAHPFFTGSTTLSGVDFEALFHDVQASEASV